MHTNSRRDSINTGVCSEDLSSFDIRVSDVRSVVIFVFLSSLKKSHIYKIEHYCTVEILKHYLTVIHSADVRSNFSNHYLFRFGVAVPL